jgi:hypothetical protein
MSNADPIESGLPFYKVTPRKGYNSASGHVVKADFATDLVTAIREALEGRRYISQPISS